MISEIKTLWIFYRKLLIPGFSFSILSSVPFGLNSDHFTTGFLFIFPLLHYLIYEVRLKNEYIFYANFGFSRWQLWIFTLSFSAILKLISSFL